MVAILGGIDIEVVAIALLFALLVGVLIVRPLLVSVLSQAPLVGGWLSSNVDAGLASFERTIQPTANAALGALSSTIDWLASTWGDLANTVAGLGELTYKACWKIANLVVPAAEQRAVNAATAALDGAQASLKSEIAAAEAAGLSAAAGARSEAEALSTGVLNEAQRLSAASVALAKGLFAIAEQDAQATAHATQALIADDLLGVRAEIEAANRLAASALTSAEAALHGDLESLRRQLADAISSDVGALQSQIAADRAALTAALSGSIAGVIADVAAIKALECLKFCSPLADVGSFLNNLDAGLLIAAVAYARAHPQEAIGFMKSDVLPLARSGVGELEALIGR